MQGEPVSIHFKADVTPYAVHTPIPIPHHWKERVKADIDRDTRLGIIEPIPQGIITLWCVRMVVTPKKNGDPRRMVYLQKLNKAASRKPFLWKPPPITRQFDPLAVGDAVQLQNQTENHPTKWHNTGIIAEILPNRQYHVAVDGSRRVNLRNRKFL